MYRASRFVSKEISLRQITRHWSQARPVKVQPSRADYRAGKATGPGQGSETNPERFTGMAPALHCAAMFARMNVTSTLAKVGLVLSFCLQLQAMDRWSALSQIESGDDDHAVGAAGEISRYQIKPEVWQRYAPAKAESTKQEDAVAVAKQAMQARCTAFERSVHRPPTDFEFYILWNAPAQVQRPGKAVAERAERFCNLINYR
jgi:hypothetical protein